MTEKIYHIYLKNKCIYHSLSEDEFKKTWEMIHNFIDIATEIEKEDLEYEELTLPKKEIVLSSSH
jgi:hypothetical protein